MTNFRWISIKMDYEHKANIKLGGYIHWNKYEYAQILLRKHKINYYSIINKGILIVYYLNKIICIYLKWIFINIHHWIMVSELTNFLCIGIIMYYWHLSEILNAIHISIGINICMHRYHLNKISFIKAYIYSRISHQRFHQHGITVIKSIYFLHWMYWDLILLLIKIKIKTYMKIIWVHGGKMKCIYGEKWYGLWRKMMCIYGGKWYMGLWRKMICVCGIKLYAFMEENYMRLWKNDIHLWWKIICVYLLEYLGIEIIYLELNSMITVIWAMIYLLCNQ